MEDSEIIALYWRRDEAAVGETRRKYGRYLAKIARNILSNREDGEEIVNDACLKAWNSIPPNRPDSLAAYLGKIARRLSIDALRTRTREKRAAAQYALSLSELEECLPGGAEPEQQLELPCWPRPSTPICAPSRLRPGTCLSGDISTWTL